MKEPKRIARLFRDHLKEQLKSPSFKKLFDSYDKAMRRAIEKAIARAKSK